jgi:hypothetical protein
MAGGTPAVGATQVANAAAKAEWDARWAAAATAAGVANPTTPTSYQAESNGMMATIPGGAATTTKGDYIGVPNDFHAYVTTKPYVHGSSAITAQGQTLGVPATTPIYKNGMDTTSWQSMNEAERIQTKTQLWYAGFYGKTRPVLNGDLSPEDVTAMNGAMTLGNMNGKSWQDAIAPRVTLGEQMGGAYNPTAPRSSSVSSGAFDQSVTDLRNFALNNGIDLTEDYIGKTAKQIADGQTSMDQVKGDLRDTHIARAYPGFAKQIMAGHDVMDLASPYISAMQNKLEIPNGQVTLKDPTIAKALQTVDDKGNPTYVPLWQFDQMLKQDSRWQYTQNAWNEVGTQAMDIAQRFGLQG